MSELAETIFFGILILCCLLNFAALFHTIYKFYIEKKTKITKPTKIVVLTAITFLSLHTVTHTTFQLFDHIITAEIPTLGCKAGVIVISVAFYIGKAFLLCFYIMRASTSFKNSQLEYSNKQIQVYCSIIIGISIISTIGWPIIQLPFTKSAIDENGKYYCIVSAAAEDDYNYHNANTYFLIYASLIEIIISIWTVWLFVGRLIRKSFSTYLNKKRSYAQNPITTDIPLSDVNESTAMTPSLDQLDYSNSEHVKIWHEATKQMNNILLVITKLLILLFIAIITSQIALVLYLTVIPRAYGIDSCVNVYCMYLSFGFTEKIWRKLFCGTRCTKRCFPLVKMWAFTTCTVSICCIGRFKKRKLTLDNDSNQSDTIQPTKYKDEHEISLCLNEEKRWMYSMVRKEYQCFIHDSL